MKHASIVRFGFLGLSACVGMLSLVNCSDDPAVVPGAVDSGTKDGTATTDGPAPSADATPPDSAPVDNDAATDGGPTTDATTDGATDGGADAAPTGRTVYGIDNANKLVSFTTTAPGTLLAAAVTITGLQANEVIEGIDFRPADGKMYGLGSLSRVYTIVPATGVATAVVPDGGVAAPFVPPLAGAAYGWDFNPLADRIRVHGDNAQNLRLVPTTGASAIVTGDTNLTYAAADVNSAATPHVTGSAYTNSVTPTPAATTLYGIDSTLNILTTFASPNNGIMTTVGALGFDTTDNCGFDIIGGTSLAADAGADAGDGSTTAPLAAYASLHVSADGGASPSGFYTVNLTTGAATLVALVGHPAPLRGIAVAP